MCVIKKNTFEKLKKKYCASKYKRCAYVCVCVCVCTEGEPNYMYVRLITNVRVDEPS